MSSSSVADGTDIDIDHITSAPAKSRAARASPRTPRPARRAHPGDRDCVARGLTLCTTTPVRLPAA
jgi:hypothetical protein